jgi:hypothetical protein
MKKTIAAVILPFLVLSFTGLISCKERKARKEQQKVEMEQVKSLDTEIQKNVYPLPTSAEVIKRLTELEVGYIIDITNPPENTNKYFTSASRAISLGVYGADLSYVTLYNIQQEVIKYMDAIRVLANDLNMSKIYNAALYDTIKKYYDKRDDLVRILTKAFNDTYAYLSDNEQQGLALLVVGGAWVEGMFLTTQVSEAAYEDAKFSRVLLDQKKSFELYLDISKPYMEDPMVKDFIDGLDPIKKVYDTLGTSLTLKNINDIKKAIEIIRSKIIK